MQAKLGMNLKAQALQKRTRPFATAVIKFCETLPSVPAALHIAQQLIEAATSADSNYRAACRARSRNEFIAKIGVAGEEADESSGWLELLVEASLTTADAAQPLILEANELLAIFVASRKTAQHRQALQEQLRQQARQPKKSRSRK
jgi:four helix bundle protein